MDRSHKQYHAFDIIVKHLQAGSVRKVYRPYHCLLLYGSGRRWRSSEERPKSGRRARAGCLMPPDILSKLSDYVISPGNCPSTVVKLTLSSAPGASASCLDASDIGRGLWPHPHWPDKHTTHNGLCELKHNHLLTPGSVIITDRPGRMLLDTVHST